MKTDPISVSVGAIPPIERSAIMDALPPQAAELAELLGFGDTITICQRLGGQRINVPLELNDALQGSQYLIDTLGRDLAQRLVNVRGNAPFEVPMLTAVERLLRDNAIRAEFDRGVSVRDICARYRISTRHVRTILNAAPTTTPRQPRNDRRDPFTIPLFGDELTAA